MSQVLKENIFLYLYRLNSVFYTCQKQNKSAIGMDLSGDYSILVYETMSSSSFDLLTTIHLVVSKIMITSKES